jgi:hypothetical protein
MRLGPKSRKAGLVAHVVTSVGWFGAVASFLALATVGLSSESAAIGRAAYVALGTVTWYVIVPFAVLSVVTGVLQSLVTSWGLVRHWWVAAKLAATLLGTLLLLVHTHPIDHVATTALRYPELVDGLGHQRIQLVGDSAAALVVLLASTVLSIVKPFGLTPVGRAARAVVPQR